MISEFNQEYKKLNQAQRTAVDAIEGPVLVVAGPGTGKTQILSLRVANILRQTDVTPNSILCLTFTNFAAQNMHSRLSQLIGPSANKVNVKTFHSFAADIMNQYPDYFWNGAELSVAPDATQIEIIQDILESLPLDNVLASRFASTLTSIHDVQKALKLAKEAGLTPEKLLAMINYNIAYIDILEPQLIDLLSPPLNIKRLPQLVASVEALPSHAINEAIMPLRSLSDVLKDSLKTAVLADAGTSKTSNTGAWKKRWLQNENGLKAMHDERRRNKWWAAVAGVYADYRKELHARGYYDYADMIVEVISQLQSQPDLLANIQERYLYVLIDEFQDTNAAQFQLAHLVATHISNIGQPNLMAVGDDDQSIYAFNGAELNNMLNFRRTYSGTKTIVLTSNYRSTQAVLDTAEAIIQQADDRLVMRQPDLIKKLKAEVSDNSGDITHLSYPTRDHQLLAVAGSIARQWSNNPTSSLAVLARKHDSLARLSYLLNERKIPISYEQQNNILDNEIVKIIFLLSKTVMAIKSGDEKLVNNLVAKLIRYPVWGFSATALWRLATANFGSPHWLDSLLTHTDESMVAFGKWLLWLSQNEAPLPLQLHYMLGLKPGENLTSPIRAYYLNLPVTTSYLEALSAMKLLIDLVREFANQKNASLNDFIRFIDLNSSLDRAVTDQSWFTSGENAVQLMTVHKSKGLEFDTVYVLDVIEDNWRPRPVRRKSPANLPLQSYGESYDDYVRLLYVATTRAKYSLVFCSYAASEKGSLVIASPLLTNVLPPVLVEHNKIASDITVLESALMWPRLDTSDEKILLRDKLENFYLSATGLLQFLNVVQAGPSTFLENQLLKLPTLSSAHMSYGTAVHAALQAGQQLTNLDQPVMPGVLKQYDTVLSKQQLSSEDLERYRDYGTTMLSDLFTTKGFALPKNGLAEVTINDIYLGEAHIGGKIDHLLTYNNRLIITDYKTGTALTSLETRDQTKVVKAWSNRTQLLFYALLASSSSRFSDIRGIECQIIYVESANINKGTLKYTPSQEDIEHIEALAVAVWQHVMDLNFPDTHEYPQTLEGITAFQNDLLSGKI